MERLLHYVWKHRLFPSEYLTADDGRTVEVIDPGLHNRDAGPDFFNAKVRIDGTLWVGNVELHMRSSEWYLHGHDADAHYDNVVLHVVDTADAAVTTSKGRSVPQVTVHIPASLRADYDALLREDRYPPCRRVIPQVPAIELHSWMNALHAERLERKTQAIVSRLEACDGSWEGAYFVTLARNYGFGVNSDAFEQWALSIPLTSVAHHRDDLFQVEAFFLGQAGMLDTAAMSPKRRAEAEGDDHFVRLRSEYAFLKNKFSLTPISASLWRYLRLRPQNFPNIRIAQMATLYHSRRASLADIVACRTIDDLRRALRTEVTPYWRTHYTFGTPSAQSDKSLSTASVDVLIINTVVPVLFAYGRYRTDDAMCARAIHHLESLKAEKNNVVRLWNECGVSATTAADSQALLQLKSRYCDRRDCLRCRIGLAYMRHKPVT